MTLEGELVLGYYSLISIIILVIANITEVKKGEKAWKVLFLIPILIYLINTI